MSTRIPNPARRHLGAHPHHFIAADETIPYFVGGKDDTSPLILQIYPHPCPLRLLPLLGFQIIGLLLISYKKDRVGCVG